MTRSRRLVKNDPLRGWGTYLGLAFVAGFAVLGYTRGEIGYAEAGTIVAAAFGGARLRAAVGRQG